MKKPKKPNLPKKRTVANLQRYLDSDRYKRYKERMKKYNNWKREKASERKKKQQLLERIRKAV